MGWTPGSLEVGADGLEDERASNAAQGRPQSPSIACSDLHQHGPRTGTRERHADPYQGPAYDVRIIAREPVERRVWARAGPGNPQGVSQSDDEGGASGRSQEGLEHVKVGERHLRLDDGGLVDARDQQGCSKDRPGRQGADRSAFGGRGHVCY